MKRLTIAFAIIVGAWASDSLAQNTDFVRYGNEALNQRKYEIAIEYYDKAILFQPRSPQAIYNRGIAYSRLGKDSLALLDYDEYLKYFPDNPTTYTARGVLFHKMGRKAEAVADLTRALELDSMNGLTWAVLGDTYLTMGLSAKAMVAWGNSVERDPNGTYASHVREQIERLKKSAPRDK